MEELEVSIQEKNDIIQRLSSELEKVGREMDQMGVKLQEVQNNNLAEYSMVDQLKQLQETIRLQDQKLAHKVRFRSIPRLLRIFESLAPVLIAVAYFLVFVLGLRDLILIVIR